MLVLFKQPAIERMMRTMAGATRLIAEGLALIAKWEGCSLTLYNDPAPARNCTIGYGKKVHDGPCRLDGRGDEAPYANGITQAQAYAMLAQVAQEFADGVVAVTRPLGPYELAALTSFAYNVGPGAPGVSDGYYGSTVRAAVNNGGDVCAALRQYNKANGRVLPGLVARREDECAMFGRPSAGEEETMKRINGVTTWHHGRAFAPGSYLVNVDIDFAQAANMDGARGVPLGATSIRVEPFVRAQGVTGVLVLADASGRYAGQVRPPAATAQIDVMIGPIAEAPLNGARGFRLQVEAPGLTLDDLGIVGWA